MDLMEYASDPALEVAGVTIPIDDETSITVAAYGNRKFREMRNRLIEPLTNAAGRRGITTAQADRVLEKCIAAHILLGWEGLKIEGEDFPYSSENCLKLLSDPRFKSFKELVMGHAAEGEHFKLERLEDDLGNFGNGVNTAHVGTQHKGQRSPRKKKKASA